VTLLQAAVEMTAFLRSRDAGLVYSGKVEQHINELYSPKEYSRDSQEVKENEKTHGPYSLVNKFTKNLVPDQKNWADESVRPRVTATGEAIPAVSRNRSATRLLT